MKILVVIGSPRKNGNTYLSVKRIETALEKRDASIGFETLFLIDAKIKTCLGCRACFDRGEASCPHKDDLASIAQKMLEVDGVVFASPTYVGSMSGLMKNFFDRLAYFCHRPAFHGKMALIVTTTGSAAAKMAAYSVQMPLGSMGFTVAGSIGLVLHTGAVVPVSDEHEKKLDVLADRFYNKLTSPKRNAPTVFSLVSFALNRQYYKRKDTSSYDYHYWKEKGWLDPGRAYFTDVKVGLGKKIAAGIIRAFLKST